MIQPLPYPKVISCRGGWFAVECEGDIGSGPWRTESAAKAALVGNYDLAHQLNYDGERYEQSIHA